MNRLLNSMASEESFDWFDAVDSSQRNSESEATTCSMVSPNKNETKRSFCLHGQLEENRDGPSAKTPAKPVVTSDDDASVKEDQLDREERRRYLEQNDVLDFLTKVLMKTDTTGGKTLNGKEPITFKDAIQLAEFDPDRTEIDILRKEIAKVDETVEELTETITDLKEKKAKLLAGKAK